MNAFLMVVMVVAAVYLAVGLVLAIGYICLCRPLGKNDIGAMLLVFFGWPYIIYALYEAPKQFSAI